MVYIRGHCRHPLRCVYLDYVKSRLQRCLVFCKVKRSRCSQLILFLPIYVLPCHGKPICSAKLYLYKYKVFPILHDQIDFSKSAAVSPGNNFVIFLPQIFCRSGFSPGTSQIISPHRTFSRKSFYESDRDQTHEAPHNGLSFRILCVHQICTEGSILPSQTSDYHDLP